MRSDIWEKLVILLDLFLSNVVASNYNYDHVLHLSLLFYEAQRSGNLPLDNRIPWRGDSAMDDRGYKEEDLTGGYYDAGDFVKFGFTMASTTTILAWGCISYKQAYLQSGEWKNMLSTLQWATDYFIKCHVSEFEFYGQVGDFNLDHQFWGRPEDLNMSRPAYKIDSLHPGSDLAGETAAALAAVSIIYSEIDTDYAEECLLHSKQLYRFATKYRGLYHEAIRGATQYYESTDYGDELTWAAAWLYKATGESQYLDEAEHHYMKFRLRERPNEFFYNKKVAGVQVLLGQLTGQPEYAEAAQAFCDYSIHGQKRTPKGLVYIEKFGTLCHAANIAFVCLQAAELSLLSSKYIEFAKFQIHYMLGDSGRSYVIGFGNNYPLQPHHAARVEKDVSPEQFVIRVLKKMHTVISTLGSCPTRPAKCGWEEFNRNGPNPQMLYGALVSGPDENDFYEDKREEYIYNEVTLDYNAGFQSAVAGLRCLQLHGTETFVKHKYPISRAWDHINSINKTERN